MRVPIRHTTKVGCGAGLPRTAKFCVPGLLRFHAAARGRRQWSVQLRQPRQVAFRLPIAANVTGPQGVAQRTVGVAIALITLGSAGCTVGGTPVEPSSLSGDPARIAAAVTACIDQVNALRASVGDPPLSRSARIDAFSAEAAQVDGEAHQAHKHFLATNGGQGTAVAENMIPWWKVSDYGSVQNVVRKGIQTMWDAGPSGYHYVNMRGGYTEMGCGIAVINGEVTVSQDFR